MTEVITFLHEVKENFGISRNSFHMENIFDFVDDQQLFSEKATFYGNCRFLDNPHTL